MQEHELDHDFNLDCFEPFPGPGSFEATMAGLVEAILEERARRRALWQGLYAHVRIAAVFAAVVTGIVLVMAVVSPKRPRAREPHAPGLVWLGWAAMDAQPSALELRQILGDLP